VADIESFRVALSNAGYSVCAAAPHDEAFGSWQMTVDTQRPSQLVWDGKDRWLILRTGGSDVWIAKDDAEQTPAAAIEQLRRHS
jgi:hypothetical protein